MPSAPRAGPRAATDRSTANVCPLSGTGVNGSGIAVCAASPTKADAPATSTTSPTAQPGPEHASADGAAGHGGGQDAAGRGESDARHDTPITTLGSAATLDADRGHLQRV